MEKCTDESENLKNIVKNDDDSSLLSVPSSHLNHEEEEELQRFLVPNLCDLPINPTSAIESNFVSYFAPDFIKPGHDQYVYRHANGLCVIGLAPRHVALAEKGGVTAVDFNVGKSDRSVMKVTGKRKRNAQQLEPNSALCKVHTSDTFYIVRGVFKEDLNNVGGGLKFSTLTMRVAYPCYMLCCVKGSLLEVNDRLIKQPELLNSSAAREGYIAIIMPKPADWLKIKNTLLCLEDYKKLRDIS